MRRTRHNGQAMTEYILIVVLCAIALLGVVTAFGNDVKRMFWTSSQSVREGKGQDVVWCAGYKDKYNHTTGALTPDTPYQWNTEAQRWYDPSSGGFVSFADASEYVEAPYMYVE